MEGIVPILANSPYFAAFTSVVQTEMICKIFRGRRHTNTAPLLALARKMTYQGAKIEDMPHPAWKPGQPQPPPFDPDKRKTIDPAQTPAADVYRLMTSAIAPRPVAFVSSVSAAGVLNLSPFSYFNMMSHDPPTLAFSVTRKAGGKKDTLANIEETEEFVVNIISEWCVESANHTCGNYPPHVNEFEVAGMTMQSSEIVVPPRVGESACQMECKLTDIKSITNKKGQISSDIVFGEIVAFHVAEELYENGRINVERYAPVSRLGGIYYGRTTSVYPIPRPQVE